MYIYIYISYIREYKIYIILTFYVYIYIYISYIREYKVYIILKFYVYIYIYLIFANIRYFNVNFNTLYVQ